MPALAAETEVAAMAAAAVALIPASVAILEYMFVASPFPTKRREAAKVFVRCILKSQKE